MAHFPNHLPARWEFTRVESQEHRNRRVALELQKEDIDRNRCQTSGLWWEDQRYIDQVVPAQFTDPNTFDNFNYRYQMYSRQPVQLPVGCLSEATDEPPPIRYNIKRIAVDKPFCPPSQASLKRHRPCSSSSQVVVLPPLQRCQAYHNGNARQQQQVTQKDDTAACMGASEAASVLSGDGKLCHCAASSDSRSEMTRSFSSISSCTTGNIHQSPRSDRGLGNNNNNNNNNNNENNITTQNSGNNNTANNKSNNTITNNKSNKNNTATNSSNNINNNTATNKSTTTNNSTASNKSNNTIANNKSNKNNNTATNSSNNINNNTATNKSNIANNKSNNNNNIANNNNDVHGNVLAIDNDISVGANNNNNYDERESNLDHDHIDTTLQSSRHPQSGMFYETPPVNKNNNVQTCNYNQESLSKDVKSWDKQPPCHRDQTEPLMEGPVQYPLEVIEAFPKESHEACRKQGIPSTFLCRPKAAWPQFPCYRVLPGQRISEGVKRNEKNVICRRIFRQDCANTPENVYLDSVDPLVVCQLESAADHVLTTTKTSSTSATVKHEPGHGTYKIIASRQHKEPPQPCMHDLVPLPEELQRYKHYQTRCQDKSAGRYDRSDPLWEMLLPSNLSTTLMTTTNSPFRYARNPGCHRKVKEERDPYHYHPHLATKNQQGGSRCDHGDDLHWKMPTFYQKVNEERDPYHYHPHTASKNQQGGSRSGLDDNDQHWKMPRCY